MADSFSVAASAVGLVSLGLQVCKGLLDYYASWKDKDTIVTSMYNQLEGTTKTFMTLEDCLRGQDLEPRLATRVEDSILSCREGINSLEKKLSKIRREPNRSSSRLQLRNAAHRALFPFKESTLVKLREVVSDLRDNVTMALDALQLYSLFLTSLRCFLNSECIKLILSTLLCFRSLHHRRKSYEGVLN